MKRKSNYSMVVAIILMIISMISCNTSEGEELEAEIKKAEETKTYFTTQADLDAAVLINSPTDTLIIGNPFVGRELAAQGNYRDILTNVSKSAPFRVGSIIVIRSYPNENGRRGELLFTDAMIKREVGYNVRGNDFEYIRIMYDSATNYSLNPNGILPDILQTSIRGLDVPSVGCINCHVTTTDFVFSN